MVTPTMMLYEYSLKLEENIDYIILFWEKDRVLSNKWVHDSVPLHYF